LLGKKFRKNCEENETKPILNITFYKKIYQVTTRNHYPFYT